MSGGQKFGEAYNSPVTVEGGKVEVETGKERGEGEGDVRVWGTEGVGGGCHLLRVGRVGGHGARRTGGGSLREGDVGEEGW